MLVSAHQGEGIDELIARIEELLPVPEELVDAVLPYQRGDLVDRIHRLGTIVSLEHTGQGTHVVAHLHPGLAAEVRAAAVATS